MCWLALCRSEESLKTLLELAESCGRMVIVSGSGLSANSGALIKLCYVSWDILCLILCTHLQS